MIKLRLLLVVCAIAALTVGVTTAAAGGGNSQDAKKCQKGGWKNYVRSNLTPFVNEGDCVSYGARGGVLVLVPNLGSRELCESYGGTFATGPDLIGGLPNRVVWVCNGWPEPPYEGFDFDGFAANKALPLGYDCVADGGKTVYWLIRWIGDDPGVAYATCYAAS